MAVLTVGYGNRSFQEFVALVKDRGVTHVVDIRSIPYSNYQTEFRRENLPELLSPEGLRYVYMGDTLGGAVTRAATGDEPVTEAVRSLELGIASLMRAAEDPAKRLCLMCGCLLPNKCHRGELLGGVLLQRGLELHHLGREGEVLTQARLEQELKLQGSLF